MGSVLLCKAATGFNIIAGHRVVLSRPHHLSHCLCFFAAIVGLHVRPLAPQHVSLKGVPPPPPGGGRGRGSGPRARVPNPRDRGAANVEDHSEAIVLLAPAPVGAPNAQQLFEDALDELLRAGLIVRAPKKKKQKKHGKSKEDGDSSGACGSCCFLCPMLGSTCQECSEGPIGRPRCLFVSRCRVFAQACAVIVTVPQAFVDNNVGACRRDSAGRP